MFIKTLPTRRPLGLQHLSPDGALENGLTYSLSSKVNDVKEVFHLSTAVGAVGRAH